MEAGFDLYEDLVDDTIEIPLLGVVAAGEAYRAFAFDETLSVPSKLWGGQKVFALRVRGNSMIDEGIHDGDFLIVQPRPTAENGQTVVAEIDGCVTVKKFYREPDGSIRLQPANPDLLPLIIRGDHISLRGVVVGVMRKYGFGQQDTSSAARKTPVRRPVPPRTAEPTGIFELSLNVIDEQLARWQMAMAQAKHHRRRRRRLVQMSELDRDLQALRDWLSRTNKPGLQRALLAEAAKLIRRMQRFAVSQPADLSETSLH